MAFTAVAKPFEQFIAKLYVGNSSTQAITGLGFQPDMVWTKGRDDSDYHVMVDSPRGATKTLYPSATSAETTHSGLTAFDSDGYTLGSQEYWNYTGENFVSWNWKGGTTSGITTDGSTTITPSAYSFNATAGISILKYTGNTTSGAGLAHGMGKKPALFIAKDLSTTESWTVYHQSLGNTKFMTLNGTNAVGTATNRWNDTDPTSVNMILGSETSVNNTNMIGYCFAEVKGFSSFGSFTGNGQLNGPMVYTGFQPAFVIVKVTNTTDGWYMWDNKRSPSDGFNVLQYNLLANDNAVEGTSANYMIDVVSNGFKLRDNNGGVNGYEDNFIYMAFAKFPFVSTNSIPTTAR